MKKIIAIFLTVIIVFCLSACGKTDGIVGKWEGTCDMTKLMSNMMNELNNVDIDTVHIVELDLELNGDGTYSMKIDADSTKDSMYNYFEDLYEAYKDIAEEKNVEPLSYREYMYIVDASLNASLGAMEEELNISGEYEVDGNKIIFDEDEDFYLTMEDDTLVFEVEDAASFVFHKK